MENLVPEDKGHIDFELGSISQKINHITGDHFGRFHEDHCASTSWSDALAEMVEDILQDASDMDSPLPDSENTVRDIYTNGMKVTDNVTRPALVVWDLHRGKPEWIA